MLPAAAQDPECDKFIRPQFKKGGLAQFRTWVASHISISPEWQIEGTVRISFVVGKEGKVEEVTLLEGVDPRVDKIVMNTIKRSPKWQPGLKEGQPVRVQYTLPITFRRPQGTLNLQGSSTGYEQRVGRSSYEQPTNHEPSDQRPVYRHYGLGL